MMGSRRDALKGLLALGASVPLVSCNDKKKAAPSPTAKPTSVVDKDKGKPRKLVMLFLAGGPDGVLTMDPKSPSEIDTWVDNPKHEENANTGAEVPLGALWAPLAPWANRMAVVHGVQVESANHFSGTWQLMRMRRRGLRTTPSIFEIIAKHRESPLGSLTAGNLYIDRTYSPAWNALDCQVKGTGGTTGLSYFDQVPRAELSELAAALRENANASGLRPADKDSYEHVVAYLDALQKVEPFKAEDWGVTNADRYPEIASLQRLTWALKHDLCASGIIALGSNQFDTHMVNLMGQTFVNSMFVPAFGRFLKELSEHKTERGGSLLDETTIVVAGEVGRFPRMNSDEGKDHFPEISVLLMGAGVNAGTKGKVLGQTDKAMLGLPMDWKTGKVGGSRHVMLDDIGASILHMFDIEPTQYGYPARPIDALVG